MATASLQTLKTLLDHAEGERDAARAALRQAEAAAAGQDAQASQLQDYRSQFRNRWSAQFSQPTTAALLQCHHGFAQRLDQAIDHQQQQCRLAEQRVLRARQQLQRREQRLAAVRKLIERRLQVQQRQAQRHEQKHTDEAAQHAAQRHRWAVGPT